LARDAEELGRLTQHGFVAELNGQVVGFAAIEIYSRKLAELLCLAVSTECHGRGIGRKLVESCIQRAEENNIYELMAITASDQLFQSCGFDYSLPNERKALFIHPSDPPRASKRLDPG